MGFITTLTANNDLIHRLPEYPDLGDAILQAIQKLPIERPVEVGHTGMTAIESHHSDYSEALLIGGHSEATQLGVAVHYGDKNPELTLLTRLAEKHGYKLVRRRPREPKT